jgi:hypothetical protein
MGDLELTVASWSDRDDLVVELTTGQGAETEDWGLVTYDRAAGRAILELYPRAGNDDWRFDLGEVRAILERAERRIMEVAGPLPDDRRPAPSDGDGSARGQATVEPEAGARVPGGR